MKVYDGNASLSKKISQDESDRIDFLRLTLVLLLVIVHFGAIYGSPVQSSVGYAGQEFAFASIFVSFMSFLGYTAVPTLSVISGYLFFRGSDRANPPDFRKMMLRRLSSLVLPFLIWSGIFVLLGYALFLMDSDFYSGFFAPEDGNLYRSVADAWLGFAETPLAIQLWFVRDLIVTVAVSPVIWLLVSRAPVLVLCALLALWLSGHTLWIFLRLDVVGFFCIGAAISMHGWRRDLPKRFVAPLAVIFLALVFGRAVAPAFLENPEESWGLYAATCLMRIVGVVTIWSAAPFLMGGLMKPITAKFCYLAFFINCSHYPLIIFIKMVFGEFLDPQSNFSHLAIYAGTIGITLVTVVIGARVLQIASPGLFSILSGGRTPLTGDYSRAPARVRG